MNKLILASRPKTLIASISPICIGTAMAIHVNAFSFWVFLFTLLTGIGIQVSTNFANDLYDYLKGADTENRKGPIRVTQAGLMSVAQMKKATICIMGFTALSGAVLVYRGGLIIALLVALALVLAFAYTAGPFPLAYLGLAEFFILVFFGPIATGFTYSLQTGSLQLAPFLAGLSPGLISCSLLIVNNLRDIGEDRVANKKTLVARFGTRFGQWEYALSLIIACTLPLFFANSCRLAPMTLLCLVPALLLIRSLFQVKSPIEYNPLLGKTGRLLSLFTFIFSLSFALC